MTDSTMHLQGWSKLMTPKAPRTMTKRQLAEKAARTAEHDRKADEAIEWTKKFA